MLNIVTAIGLGPSRSSIRLFKPVLCRTAIFADGALNPPSDLVVASWTLGDERKCKSCATSSVIIRTQVIRRKFTSPAGRIEGTEDEQVHVKAKRQRVDRGSQARASPFV